ncbi:glutamine amidotransferase [Pseudarthrobacter cellobiosi]|uniref:glutamine amidotransferase n=1 Tax=Pseudarthrobacter cellobiosi TaxID=2953654 RepID=UPI00208F9565|nr:MULTISPECIES: glutamine amidotransferase [unclassified Pseudarthrobacter]MCO4254913.1 glutamine amidotransferase [Pseudarthrobacter sp. HLT1-5]MCO4274400.1 glutamine amidotransferase [Pseudarthrobacter sp. HLT3-5]
MKPFLFLASRAEDAAAEEEYEAYLTYGGLTPSQLRRVRLEAAPLPQLDLAEFSGVIVGGSPFTSSDPADHKSETQHRVEHELAGLLDRIVARDFPFLGACYGVGTLGRHQGAVIDRTFGEQLGGVEIELTEAGLADPLLHGMPRRFTAFTGHKEACTRLPSHAVLLASSQACPVHMFRIKQNLYATQFHPELDAEGLVTRIDIYRHAGYFPPESAEELMADARTYTATEPMKILRNFVARYGN